jgi:hypothetical protein
MGGSSVQLSLDYFLSPSHPLLHFPSPSPSAPCGFYAGTEPPSGPSPKLLADRSSIFSSLPNGQTSAYYRRFAAPRFTSTGSKPCPTHLAPDRPGPQFSAGKASHGGPTLTSRDLSPTSPKLKQL